MSDLTWVWQGRYGDDEEHITLACLPEDLPIAQQDIIRNAFEKSTRDIYDDGVHEMGKMGFVRQAGNAWHLHLVWAPQVHEWLTGKIVDDDAGGQQRREQYI